MTLCCTGLVNQTAEKYGLPMRTSFSTARGFFIQMKLEGVVLPEGKLPAEFIKVLSTKGRYNDNTKLTDRLRAEKKDNFTSVDNVHNV